MTAPIPISSSPNPQHGAAVPSSAPIPQGHVNHTPNPSGSSTSTLSSSPGGPQTPFSPALTVSSASPPKNANSSILKWACSFGSLGKSPTSPHPVFTGNPAVPTQGHGGHGNDHDHDHDHDHEHHDAFEFGDISDLHRSSWTGHGRRAASMSQASGVGLAKSPPVQGGISAMLAGMNRDAGAGGGAGGGGGTGGGGTNVPLGSPPLVGGGVIAENVAKGQGLLRRLSLGGAGRGRPPLMSPTQTPSTFIPSPNPAQPGMSTSAATPTQPAPISSAPADKGLLSPANGGGASIGQRGRRYSENVQGKKRGVSPMGERILRDHGHF